MAHHQRPLIHPGARPPTAELAGVAALAAVVAIHLQNLPTRFALAPYLGVASIGFVTAATGAGSLLVRRDPRGWLVAGLTCLAAGLAWVVGRTVGYPGATDDIGNWTDGLGLAAFILELAVAGLSAHQLRHLWRLGP